MASNKNANGGSFGPKSILRLIRSYVIYQLRSLAMITLPRMINQCAHWDINLSKGQLDMDDFSPARPMLIFCGIQATASNYSLVFSH